MAIKPKDLCQILIVAGQNYVSELQFGGIVVKFHPRNPELTAYHQEAGFLPDSVPRGQGARNQPLEMTLSSEQRDMFEELERADAAVNDPVAYEQMRIDELVHEGPRDEEEQVYNR